jgi:hypothetical protein
MLIKHPVTDLQTGGAYIKFLTAVSMTIVIFWDVKPRFWQKLTDFRKNLLPLSSGQMGATFILMIQAPNSRKSHPQNTAILSKYLLHLFVLVVIMITIIINRGDGSRQ